MGTPALEYTMVRADGAGVSIINANLRKGWLLYGPPFYGMSQEMGYQAMIRVEKVDPKKSKVETPTTSEIMV